MLSNRSPDHPEPSIGFPGYLYPDDATCEAYEVCSVVGGLGVRQGSKVGVRGSSTARVPPVILTNSFHRCSCPLFFPPFLELHHATQQGVPAVYTEGACMYNEDVWGPDGMDNGAYPFGDKDVRHRSKMPLTTVVVRLETLPGYDYTHSRLFVLKHQTPFSALFFSWYSSRCALFRSRIGIAGRFQVPACPRLQSTATCANESLYRSSFAAYSLRVSGVQRRHDGHRCLQPVPQRHSLQLGHYLRARVRQPCCA